jgi:2',3'-cyclic-nucleotide 2'-phosphodiesterase (5'-nucleotidase family)
MKLTHGLLLFATSCASVSLVQGDSLDIRPLATVALSGAEISDFDPASDRLFVTASSGLQIIDLANPATPAVVTTLNLTAAPYNLPVTDVTSVAVHNGVVAVALPAADKANPGTVVFLNAADGTLLGTATVGSLPDNIAFTPDGSKVLTANEGELTDAFNGTANSAVTTVTNDATLGTVSIIDVSGGFASAPVTTADFTAYDTAPQIAALKAAGVRIFEGGKPSTDFEPEYVAISPTGTEALVVLQEANAVAILDIATATFTSVKALGEKDFSTLLADFSDRDGPSNSNKTQLTRGNPVFGLYMPDEATSYQVAGNTYYLIANEGDDRDDFLTPNETATVSSLTLDPTTFPDAVTLKTNARLGRLSVSNSSGLRGDIDSDGDVDRILAYGGRSFSILNSAGTMVYDSGDLIERAIACFGTPWFDDTRSDNKAAEPEGIEIGVIGARTYAFVGLERSRGVMAFDITDPANVTSAGFGTVSTDRNPEGIEFISAANSPTGSPLLAVTNETSNTLTIYSVAPVDYTLQLLHLADAEAGLLASSTAPNLAALVDGFDGQFPNTLILAGGDNFIPGPFLAAGTDLSVRDELNSTTGSSISLLASVNHPIAAVDIAIHNIIGVEASAIGNHEFDLSSRVFRDAFISSGGWVGAQFPYISANLNFSGDGDLASRFDNTLDGGTGTLIPEASTKKGRLVPSAVITKGGEKIGVLGATTQLLESISSPSGTEVAGFPGGPGANGEVDNMDLLASQLQPVINELIAEGVDKIVLMAHLQQIANEQLLATKLSGVDVILSAGSNTRLGDADDTAVAFAGHTADFANAYPIRTAGLDSKPVVIINTDNEFTYLGRLVVDFDANGEIIVPNLATRSAINGAYASTDANVAAAWGVNVGDLPTTAFAAGTKGTKVKTLTDAVNAVIAAKDGTVYGITTVYLEGERFFVRSEETNLGNLTADANAGALRSIAGGSAPVISLKNGGGIRAQIGAISSAGGSAVKLPPPANPVVGKPEGGISLLDLENSLRFNNRLMAFDTTPTGLKAILENSVFAGIGDGRFGQIGGMTFSWDPALPAGSRVRTVSLTDENGAVAAAIVQDGIVRPDAPATIRAVTLSFLAQGGDSYPMKANGSNFRFILDNGTLGDVLDESLDFGLAANIPANALGEIEAAAEHIAAEYPNLANAFTSADTPVASDLRIQRLSARTDTVLAYTAAEIDTLNTFYSFLVGQGLSPHQSIGNPALVAAAGTTRTAGQVDVTSNPSAFSLYTASSIQDLRGTGNLLIQASGANVTLTLPLEKSIGLNTWGPADEDLEATFPKIQGKEFYRVILPD